MKQEDLKTVKSRIERGKKYFDKENKDKFERFKNYLKIRHYPDFKVNFDRITVPMIHTIIRTKLAAIFFRNPKYIVGPKRKIDPQRLAETVLNQESMQVVMDYLPEEIDMKTELKDAILDYVAYGKGVVKVGFEFEMENKVKEGEEDVPKILVDRFYVKRVSYPSGDFIIDPEAKRGLIDARWCAERVIAPLDDVKNNKLFKNTKDLKANSKIKEELTSNEKEATGDESRVEYYYYWEKNRYGLVTKCVVLVPDQDLILKDYGNPYKHGDWPYEEVNNYQIPDYLFPLGDIDPIEIQQKELDKMESLLFMHSKRFIQKYIVNKGKLDSKAKEALSTPENALIEADEQANLRALENPSINQTIPLSTTMIKGDITQISGISEYQRGALPAQKTTLGEAQMVQTGSTQRAEESSQDVEEFLRRIGRKLMQVVQENLTSEMMILVGGDPALPDAWKQFTAEQIQGEFELSVEPYSASPINKELLKKQALDLYNLMIKDPELSTEARIELRRKVLEAFNVQNIDVFLKLPAPPPMPEGMPGAQGLPPEAGQADVISREQLNMPPPDMGAGYMG